MPQNRQGGSLQPILKVSTMIIANVVIQMPIGGQLFSFKWVAGRRLYVKRNLLIVTLWLHYTGFTLPNKIRHEFWEGRCKMMNKMHICVNPQDSLSLKNTGFLKSQVKSPRNQVSPVMFSFTSPESPLRRLACWQHAKTVICKKQPAQLSLLIWCHTGIAVQLRKDGPPGRFAFLCLI